VRDLAAISPLSAAAVLRGGRRVPPAALAAARTIAAGALRVVLTPPPPDYRSPPASLSIYPHGREPSAEAADGRVDRADGAA
jgi:hypothetical protein